MQNCFTAQTGHTLLVLMGLVMLISANDGNGILKVKRMYTLYTHY